MKIVETAAGYLEAFYDLNVEQMPGGTLKPPGIKHSSKTH